MQVGSISPIMTAPVVPVPVAGGAKVPGNGGIVPPWLLNPITILPWPLPDGNDASSAAQWSNN
jgi:hypothetical protein